MASDRSEVHRSTSKKQHLDDVAIQHRVVSRSGLDLASSCLAHVNRNYVFQGGSIDVWRFFRIKNLTRRVERLLPKLTFQLRSELRVLVDAEPARNSNWAALHQSDHVRVFRPLQSSAPR